MSKKENFGRLIAQYYDKIVENYLVDIPFYVAEDKKSGGPDLELGCRIGRISFPIA